MKNHLRYLALVVLLGLTATLRAEAQSELKDEIEALKQGQEAIRKDLAEIKKILEEMKPKPPKPFEPTDVAIAGSPFRGSATAKVTVVEFTDYQCPFCSRHVKNTLPQLLKEYVEAGKVKYVLREFPLTSIHPRAARASEAALCAGDQGKYWEMHEKLFDNQKKLGEEDLLAYGKSLSLNEAELKKCLDEKKYEKRIQADIQDGAKAGVRGTPSFLVGLTDPKDSTKIRATKFLRGAQPFEAFKQAFDELLGGGEAKPSSGSQD